ncbi:hypothetical protein SAMN06265222_1011112 [Neorhodopirellula lusitana]|uniref:Uncharacterized protein n=1 Tax=Neorhodopirellula lusitana TaxID=445327 RepID=A0ABY1PVF8_9BACT|nr:hypothetical protein SAMN06265222_1011112 [Neorhodopirellula lusitana]
MTGFCKNPLNLQLPQVSINKEVTENLLISNSLWHGYCINPLSLPRRIGDPRLSLLFKIKTSSQLRNNAFRMLGLGQKGECHVGSYTED